MYLYLYWPRHENIVSQASNNLETAFSIARSNLQRISTQEQEQCPTHTQFYKKLIKLQARINKFQTIADCQQLIDEFEDLLKSKSRHAYNHSLQNLPLIHT